MRILVYPHTLEIGGSQLNAIELAAAVRDLGDEVVVFAQPGALLARIEELELPFIEAPRPRRRPTPSIMGALSGEVRSRGIEVVHGYEWTTVLEAYWGPRLRTGVPVLATVMSMAVAPFVPGDVPLVVGTEQIAEYERRRGRADVSVIEPPVDDQANAPGVADAAGFRARYGLASDDFLIVSVSRLAKELKLEGLLTAIDAAGELAADDPAVRLVLVGDGPSADTVRTHAARVNARLRRDVVVLTGELPDPRAAYAAADLCLGMGGSALRAMAFAKPLVVQGEQGFWQLFTPDTADDFFWTGFYGRGSDASAGRDRLIRFIRELRNDTFRRTTLGQFGRDLIEQRFSLRAAAQVQRQAYLRARGLTGIVKASAARSAGQFVKYEFDRRLARLKGGAASDDFNAVPMTLARPGSPAAGSVVTDPSRVTDPFRNR